MGPVRRGLTALLLLMLPGFLGAVNVAQSATPPAGVFGASVNEVGWRLAGTADGLSVMVQSGAGWVEQARLSEPGLRTDNWIGQGCATGSGQRLMIAYAPRHFADDPVLFGQGAFAAVVDLATGEVDKLAENVTLAYHSPGCGAGETVVLSQRHTEGRQRTRLMMVDTATHRITRTMTLSGQVTSAVPVGDRVLAARGHHLVEVSPTGRVHSLGRTAGVPVRLEPTNDGVVFDVVGASSTRSALLAAGRIRSVGARTIGPAVARGTSSATTSATPDLIRLAGDLHRSSLASPARAQASVGPVDPQASCAVSRNDAMTQVYQPNPRQVEWAVSQAIHGTLTVQRPAGWKRAGLPAYRPQDLFPRPALSGGGTIPAQVVLGILAQESNLWQASGRVIEGWYGNPLVGDYYGRDGTWSIDWSNADCGYGVGQLTDHMRKSDTTWTPVQKRAVAVDYAANVAAAVQVLATKWNQVRASGMRVNNGDPRHPENWFAAIWAYNSGWHPQGESSSGNYGLGWFNNPVNPDYPPDRLPFLHGNSYADAAHPQDWPYPEKVLGWGAWPLANPRTGAAYRAAWWNNDDYRFGVKPPRDLFCGQPNDCDPASLDKCLRSDYHCWWNESVGWKTCPATCGNGVTRFDSSYPEQPDSPVLPLRSCGRGGLPADAVVIDSLPPGTAPPGGCDLPPTTSGTFAFRFDTADPASSAARIDLHQVSLGFGGHAWFTSGRTDAPENAWSRMRGTWRPGVPMPGWTRVLAFVPPRASSLQQARFVIDTGGGTPASHTRTVNMSGDDVGRWISLGAYRFGSGTPSVTLKSTILTGSNDEGSTWDGEQNLAWDAVAFDPLPAAPRYRVAVIGDSYTSGEGATLNGPSDYLPGTDQEGDDPRYRNNCHRSRYAWWTKVKLHDGVTLGAAASQWRGDTDVAFVACSGARTFNLDTVSNGGLGQEGEVPQLDSGALNVNTTDVLMTIGGNDAGFASVLQTCIALVDCEFSPEGLATPGRIRTDVQNSISAALRRVAARAPNATIYLASYPLLVSLYTGRNCLAALDDDEIRWIREMGDLMATETTSTVSDLASRGVRVRFVDPRPEFEGHEACTSDEYLHGIVSTKTPGESPSSPVSQEGFHPNADGTSAYARAFDRVLPW